MTPARIAAIGAAVAVALYTVLLVQSNSFVAGGSDSSGYLNEARLMARGRATEEVPAISQLGLTPNEAELFIPLGYRVGAKAGTMAPTYPPGLPLHMAVLGMLGGWNAAPFLAGPIAAIAAVLLLFAVARELGLPRGYAAAGSVMLAVSPIFFGMAVQPMSDVPATAWVLAAIFFGLRARRRLNWAVAAGAALGVAVLVRPTNALAAIPLFLALPPGRGAVARALIGGLPAAAAFLGWNLAAYGKTMTTGYGSILPPTMSASNVLPQIRHYGFWLPALLTPLIPLAWIGVGFDRRVPRRDRALLIAWFAVFFAFYCFYEVYTDWWSVRFLLPGIPAMILAALLVARDAPLAPRWKRVLGPALLAAVVGVANHHADHFRLRRMWRGEAVYRDASRGAARLVPSESLIAAMQMSGAIKYYAGRPILRWDRVAADQFADLRRRASERGIELYALLWPFEVAGFASHLPGDWTPAARFGPTVLYRLDSPAPYRRSSRVEVELPVSGRSAVRVLSMVGRDQRHDASRVVDLVEDPPPSDPDPPRRRLAILQPGRRRNLPGSRAKDRVDARFQRCPNPPRGPAETIQISQEAGRLEEPILRRFGHAVRRLRDVRASAVSRAPCSIGFPPSPRWIRRSLSPPSRARRSR